MILSGFQARHLASPQEKEKKEQHHEEDLISIDEALKNADSENELRLRIKLEGKASKGRNILDEVSGFSLEEKEEDTGTLG